MEVSKGTIYELLNGNRQLLIPIYQRFYDWDLEQCERLWNDIVAMQKNNKTSYFIGPIVDVMEPGTPTSIQKITINDGQQRITTLILLLVALRNYAKKNPGDMAVNADRIDNTLLKNPDKSGDEQYKLLLNETDGDILMSLIDEKPIQPSKRSKLLDCYNFFVTKIDEKEISPDEAYESINKLQIADISLDRNIDDVQAIFESMNSTGKRLSETDLIRNYIFMGLGIKEQADVYKKLWHPMEDLFNYEKQGDVMDAFFRHYLTMKLSRIPKQGSVYEEFKQYCLGCELTINELCQDLLNYAKFYTNIIYKKSLDLDLKKLYEDIVDMKMEVSYPFLLQVHHDQEEGLITTDELKEILKLCISYVLRRAICAMSSNSLNKTFARLKNKIEEKDYLNSVKAFFVIQDANKEFPDDDKFKAEFKSHDIYNMRLRNYILKRLENYNRKAPINIEGYTIEHIMPQNKNLSSEWKIDLGSDWKDIQKKYLHTIGNLTLTSYNSEMSDKSFEEKLKMKGGFKESALNLNSSVVMQTEWNEKNIQKRACELANIAINIWPYPSLTDAELAPYQEKPEGKYSLNTYNKNAFTEMLFEELDKPILSLSSSVKKEYKRDHVAYNSDTNFVNVELLDDKLRISVNMKLSEISNPNSICREVTESERLDNGDVEMFMKGLPDLDSIMEIVKQSFDAQAE